MNKTFDALLSACEQDDSLMLPDHYVARADAADALERLTPDSGAESARLDALYRRWRDSDRLYIEALRAHWRAGDRARVAAALAQAWQATDTDADDPGYDALDALVTDLFDIGAAPQPAAALDAEMVFYQPTPAHVILRLLTQLEVSAADVVYDLGAGLGQVALLVALLTDAQAVGVERDAAYVSHAEAVAGWLTAQRVRFVTSDARRLTYDDGTIFYLYTPFTGGVLRAVLDRLARQSAHRTLTVCTYGACTVEVALADWLVPVWGQGRGETRLGVFRSRASR